MLFRKRPRALVSNVELTSPVFPGRIGDLVQSVTVHPQEVVTLDITNGLSPLFVILKVAVTGFFHKMVPNSCIVLSKEAFGCAKTESPDPSNILIINIMYFIPN